MSKVLARIVNNLVVDNPDMDIVIQITMPNGDVYLFDVKAKVSDEICLGNTECVLRNCPHRFLFCNESSSYYVDKDSIETLFDVDGNNVCDLSSILSCYMNSLDNSDQGDDDDYDDFYYIAMPQATFAGA